MRRGDPSAIGEFLGKRAGFWQSRFMKAAIAAVAHCRDSRLDLLNRHFRHLRITASFGEEHKGDA
jgi:hypothetical protein